MIEADFDVGRGLGGKSTAEEEAFAGGLKKVVDDAERSAWQCADPSLDGLRVGASTQHVAVKIGDIGILDGYAGGAAHIDPTPGLAPGRAMNVQTIQHDLVHGTLLLRSEVCNHRFAV